jgi:NAD(P)-dependent dehydrogenase (short-subunit alcohol dehydrogenase family)
LNLKYSPAIPGDDNVIRDATLISMNLKGHAAIVTGGGSGLGAATALRLAESGAKVAIFDVNLQGAENIAARCGGVAVRCDVSDAASATAAMAEARQKHGAARVLVNCAGIGLAKRIVGKEGPMPLEDFNRVIQVNLIGTFDMMRLAAADMSTLTPLDDGERGVIVSTASIAAYEGQIGQAAYSASKGGIVALTMPAARELAQFGIRVLAIAPGLFLTPLLQGLPAEVQASLGASIPFPKRLGDPPEFASLALHCIENRYLNGEVIRLDGSLRMAPR